MPPRPRAATRLAATRRAAPLAAALALAAVLPRAARAQPAGTLLVDVNSAAAAANNPSYALGTSGGYGANDFTVNQAVTITGASVYFYDLNAPFTGTLRYFLTDALGGAPTATGTVSTFTRTDVYTYAPAPSLVVRRYDFTFSLPAIELPGTHYFGLHVESGGSYSGPNWVLPQNGGTSYTSGDGSSYGLVSGDLPFRLYGAVGIAPVATAPEPATWALVGAGLLGVGGAARRRRARPA